MSTSTSTINSSQSLDTKAKLFSIAGPVAKASLTATNKQAVFGGFVVCTFVIACGLSSLEVAANSYVSCMPPLKNANFRLQFSQSFNGVASFAGPLIASTYFFTGAHANNLTTVQYVYLAVACMGAVIIVAFVATKLPEVSEAELEALHEAAAEAKGETAVPTNFWRTKAPLGFLTQFVSSFILDLSYSTCTC